MKQSTKKGSPAVLEIQFGTETEIGITRQEPDGTDVVSESIALVRSATAPGVRMRWDYSCEDPHRDARGFRVKELLQDNDESNFFAQDAQRAMTFSEIKSDLVLRNGARFYNDHAHPEYCAPECSAISSWAWISSAAPSNAPLRRLESHRSTFFFGFPQKLAWRDPERAARDAVNVLEN